MKYLDVVLTGLFALALGIIIGTRTAEERHPASEVERSALAQFKSEADSSEFCQSPRQEGECRMVRHREIVMHLDRLERMLTGMQTGHLVTK